ncbi:CAP domain-containing protein [Aliigemmobacter aestuarii]|nr:CAP domain-containing protein [Gemmobacter aestuarii]
MTMRLLFLPLVLSLSACVVVAPVPLGTVTMPGTASTKSDGRPLTACPAPADAASLRASALAQINARRKAAGLAPLRRSAALERAAQSQACDNAARGLYSHTGADGSDLRTRMRRAGYAFRTGAENTAMGFPEPGRLTEFWMRSPGHRQNILLPAARDIGIGIADGGRRHWVMVAGASR